MTNEQLKRLAAILWGIVLLAALVLSLSFIAKGPPEDAAEQSSQPTQQAQPLSQQLSPPPSLTPTFSPTARLPTATALPSSTPTSSATPLPFAGEPEVIGYSVENRPIEVYRFGVGKVERMIVAGIHGGYEWNTSALARELATYIHGHPASIPLDKTIYILPALNPDGAARSLGYAGRANENGVDLNRNFPEFWQSDWPRQGCWNHLPISAGNQPLSEPEAAALADFISRHALDALISYHSAGLGIFPGGRIPDPASISLAKAVAAVSPYPYPPVETGCLYTGQLTDWLSANGTAALDVELSDHASLELGINLQILEVFLNWERPGSILP